MNFIVFNPSPVWATDAWWNLSWLYRVKITVNSSQVPSTQSNFPVYVNLADLPAGFFSHVKSDGGDIRVTNSSGTELPREVVAISTGSSTGEFWFSADSISDASYFYIYYGNSSASEPAASASNGSQSVWKDGGNDYYKAVWHMQDDGPTTAADSTSNGNTGTDSGGGVTFGSTGKIGKATSYDGMDDSLDAGTSASTSNLATHASTFSAWVNLDTGGLIMGRSDGNSSAGWVFGTREDRKILLTMIRSSFNTRLWADDPLRQNVWEYVTVTTDGSGTLNGTEYYVNGAPASVNGGNGEGDQTSDLAYSLQIGQNNTYNDSMNWLKGLLDEVRISNVIRSADWVAAEYKNQSAPTSFYTVAGEEVPEVTVPGAPIIGTATRGNASASVTFAPPVSNGNSEIIGYTVTSSPGGFTGTGASSPIVVSGLTNGTSYTFSVTATNAVGTGPASEASNSVIPGNPPTGFTSQVYQDATGDDGIVDRLIVVINGGEALDTCTVDAAELASDWTYVANGLTGTSIASATCDLPSATITFTLIGGSLPITGTASAPTIGYDDDDGDHSISNAIGDLGTVALVAITDNAAPVIASVNPAADTEGVALSAPIVITFSEPMTGPGTSCTFSSSPDPGSWDDITSAANWSGGGTIVTLSHESYNRGSTVTLTVGGCTAASGGTALHANVAVPNPWTFAVILGGSPARGESYTPPSASAVVTLPNGGETLNAGQQIGISWAAANGAFVKFRVSYSADNGNNWSVLTDTLDGNATSYTWTVPTESTTQGLIKVEGIDYNGTAIASDVSNAVFTVKGTTVAPPPVAPPGVASPVMDSTVNGTYDPATAMANNPDFNTDMNLPPASPFTAWCVSGSLIKTRSSPSVYYCGNDGKRYVFVNDKVFFSWYLDFSTVQNVSEQTMAEIMIGGNITYRPGSRMVKIQTDPKVYAVARGGVLRWVQTEAVANRLYGADWNTMIDDLSDSFFVNYIPGSPIVE